MPDPTPSAIHLPRIMSLCVFIKMELLIHITVKITFQTWECRHSLTYSCQGLSLVQILETYETATRAYVVLVLQQQSKHGSHACRCWCHPHRTSQSSRRRSKPALSLQRVSQRREAVMLVDENGGRVRCSPIILEDFTQIPSVHIHGLRMMPENCLRPQKRS